MPIAFPIDPFIDNEILIEFAVMNPGVDNGPWNPFSSVDFLRSDVFSYAGGEGIATLWFRACTGGLMAVKGFGSENELVFLPLTDFTWSNIVISYNFGADTFALTQDGNTMFSGPLLDTFAPGWTIEGAKADLTVFTGSQYAIDEVQRKLIAPPSSTIILINDSYNMTYFSDYQSYATLQGWDALGTMYGSFDTGILPTDIISLTTTEATFSDISAQTVIAELSMPYQPWVWEYQILNPPPGSLRLQVGYFTQAYGPPFDPNTFAGGPLSSYYASDGAIEGYGSSAVGDSWGENDVIGVIYNAATAQIAFFKNGVFAGMANVTTGDGFAMAGAG